ncbi:MAG: amino acid decarboxylase [Acidobacteria bacterium]|nr:MAG: amino acid decarboxylase [Acidobacteriota bacterium]
MTERDRLDRAQIDLGDMDEQDFRRAAGQVADRVADYLAHVERYRVVPDIEPGDVRARIPAAPPEEPEPWDAILADYATLIEPNITHWQHPGYMAYFCSTAPGPGVLGEWLAAGLNSNVMFWRNAPASTELEEVVVAWLRQMLGLPEAFDGMFTDTASVSSLLSIVAARHVVPGLDARERGLAGRDDIGPLRMYLSDEAHSSIEKAAIVAGVGRAGVRRIPTDDAFRMRPDALAEAVAEDRAQGFTPFCVVATLGTTSSTSVDPAGPIADVCERERLWLHIDAAYAGAAALLPERRGLFEGWERADSIVVNPHKWLMTPFDASLLLFRRPEVYRDALSLVPEYLRTNVRGQVHDFHEYGIQLGRRFRALKLWIMIRYFGVEGFRRRLRESIRHADTLAGWVEAEPGWRLVAPHPFSTLCIRHEPDGLDAEATDAHNARILETVNRDGRIFLSHTKLRGRYVIRVTFGNPRCTMRHVELCWHLLRDAANA